MKTRKPPLLQAHRLCRQCHNATNNDLLWSPRRRLSSRNQPILPPCVLHLRAPNTTNITRTLGPRSSPTPGSPPTIPHSLNVPPRIAEALPPTQRKCTSIPPGADETTAGIAKWTPSPDIGAFSLAVGSSSHGVDREVPIDHVVWETYLRVQEAVIAPWCQDFMISRSICITWG